MAVIEQKAKSDPIWLSVFLLFGLAVSLDPGRWLLHASKKRVIGREQTSWLMIAIDELNSLIKLKSVKHDMKRVWEPMLRSAQLEIEHKLDLEAGSIKTNLLLCGENDSLTVVARSKAGSPVPKTYKIKAGTPSAKSLQDNRTHVSSDIKVDWGETRPYKSVVATPISSGRKAYGVITADSAGKSDFKGKENIVNAVLRPYCSLVLLTLDDKIPHRACPDLYDC